MAPSGSILSWQPAVVCGKAYTYSRSAAGCYTQCTRVPDMFYSGHCRCMLLLVQGLLLTELFKPT